MEGGNTPLYDAVYSFTNKAAEEAPNANQAVIVFTDGEDRFSDHDLSDAIENAQIKGVQVFAVGLSSGIEQASLQKLAFETGGSFMLPPDAQKLVSLYGALGKLLAGNTDFYHTCWYVVRTPDTFEGKSGYFKNSVKITGPNDNISSVPFLIEWGGDSSGDDGGSDDDDPGGDIPPPPQHLIPTTALVFVMNPTIQNFVRRLTCRLVVFTEL